MSSPPRITTIKFYHIPSGQRVEFLSFITDFKDAFVSDWNETPAYGRMDPIGTYKRTGRKISLSWTVPSVSLQEAMENMRRAQDMMKMLYPMYSNSKGRSKVLKAAPLFRVLFANFIQDTGASETVGTLVEEHGLVCGASGFTFDPDMDEGFYTFPGSNAIFPQKIAFSCDLTVYHSHELGWDENKRALNEGFPYKAGRIDYDAGDENNLENFVGPPQFVGPPDVRPGATASPESNSGQRTTIDESKANAKMNKSFEGK